MSKFLTLPSVLMLIMTTQAHAGFLFCESKIKKIGITPEDAKQLCDDKANDSIKKMLDTESSANLKNALSLMMNSKKDNQFRATPEEALFIAKKAPESLHDSYAILIREFKGKDAMEMVKKPFPEDKFKQAVELATAYQSDGTNFIKFISSESPEKLSNMASLSKVISFDEAKKIASKYKKEDIDCGLSFTSAETKSLKKNIDTCYDFNKGNLCGAKASIFESLSKQPDSKLAGIYLERLTRSDRTDYLTRNQASLFSKLYSAGYAESMEKELRDILFNELVPAELIKEISLALEKPSTDEATIRKIMKKYPITTRRAYAPKMYIKGSVSAEWGNGSHPACTSNNGYRAIFNAYGEAEANCRNTYEGKTSLSCEQSLSTGDGQMICSYVVTVSPVYWPDNTLTCYDLDTVENLVSLEVLNPKKKDSQLYINDQYTKEKLISVGVSEEAFIPKTKTSSK